MATKISELSAAGALTGTEIVPLVQSSTTKRTTAQAIANLAPSGSTALLAYISYRNGTDTATFTTTSTSYVDVDATNAAITFTVPASGKVLFTAGAFADMTAASDIAMCVRNGGSTVSGTEQLVTSITTPNRFSYEAVLTGLTPSASYTAKLGWKGTIGSTTHRIYTGPAYGALVLTVVALP